MVTVKPKKSLAVRTVALIAGATVCLLAVVAILAMSSPHHEQPNLLTLMFSGNDSYSYDQVTAATSVLRDRFIALNYDASVSQIVDNNGRAFIYVHYGNVSTDRVTAIATTPGRVEMRIQTTGNLSDHILSGGGVKSASCINDQGAVNRTAVPGVSMVLTPEGAGQFRQKCIDHNATGDPENHRIIVTLDGKTISVVPLSPGLTSKILTGPVDTLAISMSTDANGQMLAEKLCASLAGGELPAPLKVAES